MLPIAKLLMIVVAGQAVVDRGQAALRQNLAVDAIVRYGGFVYYDFEYVGDQRKAGRQPTTPRWLRSIVGDDFFQDVVAVNLVYGDSPEGKMMRICNDHGLRLRVVEPNGPR